MAERSLHLALYSQIWSVTVVVAIKHIMATRSPLDNKDCMYMIAGYMQALSNVNEHAWLRTVAIVHMCIVYSCSLSQS